MRRISCRQGRAFGSPPPRRRTWAAALAALLYGGLMVSAAAAQSPAPRIWDIALGTHVGELPGREFVDCACGTNGGPRGLPLDSFADFANCRAEDATDLHEVWFVYDDLLEYTARARRLSDSMIELNRATKVLNQPVILSLLIDSGGLVQGFRIVTDGRAEPELRAQAYGLGRHYQARYGLDGWQCVDLPRLERETPFGGMYAKERCEKVSDGVKYAVESRLYYRPGQAYIDPRTGLLMVNEFESSARLELYRTDRRPAAAPPALPAPRAAAPRPVADGRAAFLAGLSRDCPRCDLRDADLKRMELAGADLSGADLAGAILHRANLRGANLGGANLAGANLNKAVLINADLRRANLTAAMLYEADASRADFSGADLSQGALAKARFILAKLDGAALNGADLYQARLNQASLVRAALNATDLVDAVLFRADLRGAEVQSADMMGAQLRGADLSGAVLRRSDLYGAELIEANLTGTDLSATRLLSANLHDAKLIGTIFTGALMPDNTWHP
jgi:uncharacterized protein YjbI with pentapeptide repeats